MATQGIQGHHMIPEATGRAVGRIIAQYIPGWSVNGEYNFDARPSSQMGSAQLVKPLHSGPHGWIKESLTTLINGLETQVDEVTGELLTENQKVVRMAALMNFMAEANNLGNLAESGKTGGFVAFSSARDPHLIKEFDGQPSRADMRDYFRDGLSWETIMSSPAGQEVVNSRPRIGFLLQPSRNVRRLAK